MGGKKISERSIKKKSGPTHPHSRRATQLARVALRKDKLNHAKAVRGRSSNAKVDRLSTLVLMLPDTAESLPDLAAVHAFVREYFLTRHDDEIQQLEAERRAGRPPPKRLVELKDLKAKEAQEYHDGIEIPDFTSITNVQLLRDWEGDPQALPLFRMVRISGKYTDDCKLINAGTHKLLQLEHKEHLEKNSKSTESTDMDTTSAEQSSSNPAFQRVGEFAQMG
ncbi:hypothetical protein BCV70DRAFT_201928 [Testicularia cyperi]|uniref:Translation machinery-associated protein 16 n=1 Tax=Testicularia cyperi TaxID=1882483 RepID=A0A317XMR1_9BASI|nr:hypothetical protein BCV70DRAFT_201928 [Testicularia cyperi]